MNNKKGFIYMLTVMIFLVILIVMFYTYEVYKPSEKDDSIESRIRSMDDFITDLKIDSERAAYISGFRTMIALEEYVSEKGVFLTDLESAFKSAFYNGTIGNYTPLILDDSKFSLYIQKVNQQSNSIDISMNISVVEINFSQDNPWSVKVDILANVQIVDNKALARWDFNETFESRIPINGLKDPLYSVNTLGRMQGFIVMTNVSEFVVNNDTSNLMDHIEGFYYKASTSAPNFLMRFEGDLSADPMGIESLVDISFLEDQEDIVVDYTRSVVDYIYFGNQSTNNKCSVQNMPSWFRIDENHLASYEIDELTYINCTT